VSNILVGCTRLMDFRCTQLSDKKVADAMAVLENSTVCYNTSLYCR
jgi:hypothetical protein